MFQTLVFAPLVGALIAGLLGAKLGDKLSMLITTVLLFVSCGLSWYVFNDVALGHNTYEDVKVLRWMDVGGLQANWAFKIDTLTAVMLVVVTTVSALVHLYSWGYMEHDEGKARFFAYLSLFTFAMLMLVTSNNFIQLFFGWEGVGLASYLLIGFYYKKPSANAAAIKAFVTNRVGDVGLALGIFTIFALFGTVNFEEVFAQIKAADGVRAGFAGFEFNAIELIAFFLFIGAMGKSAQFVLHVWLPDAMEGPTPVSALIHAATMVTAGVFLVCRAFPIYEAAPVTSALIASVGAFTALFAATVGLVQNDIKRVIAYSTASQLGYMFFAAGVGAYNAAMFHLFTHAFFKALLFLGAGSVIHALHHQQDMREMGGLWKKIPLTYAAMIIGTLAITGVGIPGTQIGFAGFFSKDAIIEAAYAASESGGGAAASFAFIVGIVAALLTSFYSWRLIFMTFHGDYRGKPKYLEEAHESPLNMLVPLGVLAFGAVLAGTIFYKTFMYDPSFWNGSLPGKGGEAHAIAGEYVQYASMAEEVGHGDGHSKDHGGGHHDFPAWVLWAPVFVSALGFVIAWFVYMFRGGVKKHVTASKAGEGGAIYKFLLNKWYIDELYEATILRWTRWFGDLFWKGLDQGVIDRFGPNGVASVAAGAGRVMSRFQSGHLYHYAFVMLLGLALIFLAVFMF